MDRPCRVYSLIEEAEFLGGVLLTRPINDCRDYEIDINNIKYSLSKKLSLCIDTEDADLAQNTGVALLGQASFIRSTETAAYYTINTVFVIRSYAR
jgi:hypothetical protein